MQKRFVAGAVCPSCQELDKVVIHVGSSPQVRECVACGYKDTLDDNGNIRELSTRVNKVVDGDAKLPHQDDLQILRLD